MDFKVIAFAALTTAVVLVFAVIVAKVTLDFDPFPPLALVLTVAWLFAVVVAIGVKALIEWILE